MYVNEYDVMSREDLSYETGSYVNKIISMMKYQISRNKHFLSETFGNDQTINRF